MFSLTELGNRLKEAREAKKMSLDDLQEITKIQKRYLRGIEEGNYSSIPGKFYVRAFIKQYAEAVGIEPEELFEEYKTEIPSTHNEELPEQMSRVQSKRDIQVNSSKIYNLIPTILIIVFIVGAAVVFYYFFVQKNTGDQASPAKQKESEAVNYEQSDKVKNQTENKNTEGKVDSSKKEAENKKTDKAKEEEKTNQDLKVVEQNGGNTTYELKNADKFELKIVSTGETWVGVTNGSGNSLFSGTLKAGENESQTLDVTNESEVKIVAGASTATDLYINGKKLEYAVSPDQFVTQNITIRYVKSNQ